MRSKERQRNQNAHDLANHFDIASMSRIDRLKHYGLHFAKYAGRLARGGAEVKTREETIVDAFLVSLSAANSLNQLLPEISVEKDTTISPTDLEFIDHSGRFADACEKIDHLEGFLESACEANASIYRWVIASAVHSGMDIDHLSTERREALSRRPVFSLGD